MRPQHTSTRGGAWRASLALMVGLPCLACAASPPRPHALSAPECGAASPTDTPAPHAGTSQASDVAGTWLYSCCDGNARWLGMIVLTRSGSRLSGAFLTDGDSHGSYVEGTADGDRVRFTRRWLTDAVLHEQHYDLTHDVTAGRLVGSFTEPAFESVAHRIDIVRGFSNAPRAPSTPKGMARAEPGTDERRGADTHSAQGTLCSCSERCRCSGTPPGRQLETARALCPNACQCTLCPPLP